MCGEESHWEEDCPQADVDMPQAKRRVTFARPPVGVGVSQAWCVETWTVSPSTDSAEARLKTWTSQEIQQSTNLMGVTLTMPEGHAILDCGAALESIGEVAAARTAQVITASGETRRPAVLDKIQRFKFSGDGDPVEASFAVTLPVQIGDAKTWIEAFVVPGSTPHLISRRWLSQHRCVANFDPNNLYLESPEFGSVPLGNSTLVRRRSDHPVEFAVHLDDPNEEITEQTVPQEDLLPCLHRRHQLLPGSNAVSVYLTCLDCRHHAKWTHRTGPTFQQFPELQQMVQAWWTKLQRRQG